MRGLGSCEWEVGMIGEVGEVEDKYVFAGEHCKA